MIAKAPTALLALAAFSLALTAEPIRASGTNKVVCYYASWAHYRTGAAKYTVDDVPVEMCTHVIYSFAVLDSNSLIAVEHDSSLDKDTGYGNYRRFLQLRKRNPKVKLLLGLGGWTDSRSDKYSRMVSSPRSRATFVSHVVRFLKEYGFDGLDLDWEYPGYQTSAQDKEGFRLWVEELRTAFNPHGLLLTAAVSASKNVINRGYDVPAVAAALDQIHIMAYDFHGPWEKQVAHHAPLYSAPGQPEEFSADFAIRHWIRKGTPPAKLILGVPFYGKSWTLAGSDTSTGAAASGAGRPGPLMKASGTLAYYEICSAKEREGWKKSANPEGPHLFKGDQWVGYDDIETITKKTQYAKAEGLGGIMIWDIAMDDFRGTCSNGVNPLLTAIFKTLGGLTGGGATAIRPTTPTRPITTVRPRPTNPTTSRPLPESTTTSKPGEELNAAECKSTGYTIDINSCSHFFRCIGNRVYHFQCPSGLYWNQSQGYCDWHAKGSCKSKPVLRFQSQPPIFTSRFGNRQREVIRDRVTGALGSFSHFL